MSIFYFISSAVFLVQIFCTIGLITLIIHFHTYLTVQPNFFGIEIGNLSLIIWRYYNGMKLVVNYLDIIFTYLFNSLNPKVAIIKKPVNCFPLQIN